MATMSDWILNALSILAIGSLLLIIGLSINNLLFWYSLSEELHSIKNAGLCIEEAYVFGNCRGFTKRPVSIKNNIISTEHISIRFHLKAEGNVLGQFECIKEGDIKCKAR